MTVLESTVLIPHSDYLFAILDEAFAVQQGFNIFYGFPRKYTVRYNINKTEKMTPTFCKNNRSGEICFRNQRYWANQIYYNNLYGESQTKIFTSSPTNACVCVQVRGSKRLGCNACYQEVSRCNTRGESEKFIVCLHQVWIRLATLA